MKTYNVAYTFITQDEATVTAKSEKDAIKKIKEIIKDIKVIDVYEVNNHAF